MEGPSPAVVNSNTVELLQKSGLEVDGLGLEQEPLSQFLKDPGFAKLQLHILGVGPQSRC